MNDLRNLRVIKPDIAQQSQFAQIVEKVEALKAHYQASLKELENLYGSLSQLAFKGELDLSGMVIDQADKRATPVHYRTQTC